MSSNFDKVKIGVGQAGRIVQETYGLAGSVHALHGDMDFNFRLDCPDKSYLLKITRPDYDPEETEFQQAVLTHVKSSPLIDLSPEIFPDKSGDLSPVITDDYGSDRLVRLLSWMPGRVLSSVNPQSADLLESIGEEAGRLTKVLSDFDHPYAHRSFEWDLAQSLWTKEHTHLFDPQRKKIVEYFQLKYEQVQARYQGLRKSIVHSDVNDNNIIVSRDMVHPRVKALIDYGDTIYTQSINDLSIAVGYGLLAKVDVLDAAVSIIKGYHRYFPLLEEELNYIYVLAAMRLVTSITMSTLSRQIEPENEYRQMTEKPAWDALEKWYEVDENLAYFSFRDACALSPHPNYDNFESWSRKQSLTVNQLFAGLDSFHVEHIDMSVGSTWLGHEDEYSKVQSMSHKLSEFKFRKPQVLMAGGYLESRPFYTAEMFKKEGNSGWEYRTVHLGIDFWVDARTQIFSVLDGVVLSIHNNANDKDYGPTLIIEHKTSDGLVFYSLYGHLSTERLRLLKPGQTVKVGDPIADVGESSENGGWAPHLHFQIILDLLGNKTEFPGVAFPRQKNTWQSICPDPNLLFSEPELDKKMRGAAFDTLAFREEHLGKSLSLSYDMPLNIVRGVGVHLLDEEGQKYLDTVNNVAHVGHEHPRVVEAGRRQMSTLNTNTRYLHQNINDFAEALLGTLPDELSVVHFVNSGSEANELALRMTQVFSGEQDMIAMEVGYHGNTGACINVSSYKFDGDGGNGAPEYTHIVPLPDRYRGIYQGEGTGMQYAAHVQTCIDDIKAKGRSLAGFICESIISCGGQIELPENFLKRAYELIRDAGGVCIADEVQVGCGRMGSHFWGFQMHNVIPDIVTIGKPIGNGHPLAAVVCTREIADAFANGMEYFNTFGGNPVSSAIGKTVLDVIKAEGLQENAFIVGRYIKSKLKALQLDFPIIGDVRGQGLFLGFELVDEGKQPLADKASYLVNRMKELGVLMSTDGQDHNVIKIKPPMVFSTANADELILRLKQVFAENYMNQT